PRTIERHVFVEFGDGVAQRIGEGGWIDSAAHEERHGRNSKLLMRNVNLRLRRFAKGCQVKIADHPTDLPHRGLAGSDGTAGLDPFPERIFAGKIFVYEALGDNSDRRRINVVAFSEVAAAQQ